MPLIFVDNKKQQFIISRIEERGEKQSDEKHNRAKQKKHLDVIHLIKRRFNIRSERVREKEDIKATLTSRGIN